MATSQYSFLRQYQPYVSPYNVDLMKDVMLYKQQKVDANRSKLYEQMDYMLGQQMAKPEDRAYFENRASEMLGRINRDFAGADLSSDGITRAIQGQISTILDDKVINAIAGTKEYQKLNDEIEYIKANHPELYSPINELQARMPFYNWMSDGKVGSRLGTLHYTPYYDYSKEITDQVKSYREANKGKKMQFPIYGQDGNETGALIEVNHDQMSYSQIRSFGTTMLTGRAAEQMQIEAAYLARTNPTFQDPGAFAEFANSYLTRYDQEIASIEAKMKTVGDNQVAKSLYGSQLQEAKNMKAAMAHNINTISRNYSPQAAASFVIQNNFLDNLASTWKYDNTSVERKKDEFWFARRAEDREEQKFSLDLASLQLANQGAQLDNQIKQQQLEQEKIKTELGRVDPYALVSRRSSSSSSGSRSSSVDANGNPVGPFAGTIPVSVDSGATMSDRSLLDELADATTAAGVDYTRKLNILYGALKPEDVAEIVYETGNNPEIYAGMSNEERVFHYLKNNDGIKSDYLSGNNRALNAFNDAMSTYDDVRVNSDAYNSIVSSDAVNNLLADVGDIMSSNGINGIEGLTSGDYLLALLTRTEKTHQYTGAQTWSQTLISYEDNAYNYNSSIRNSNRAPLFFSVLKNEMNKNRESFDPFEYFIVDPRNGNIELRDGIIIGPSTPKTIRDVLSARADTSTLSAMENSKRAINKVVDDSVTLMNEELADTSFSRSFKRFSWNSSESDSDRKDQYNTLFNMYFSKRSAMGKEVNDDLKKGTVLMEIVTSYRDGQEANYLVRNGDDSTAVQITPDEWRDNRIPLETMNRKFRIENYRTGPKDIIFADPTTKGGRDYWQQMSYDTSLGGYGMPGISYKADVENSLKEILRANRSLFSDNGAEYMQRAITAIVNAADYLSVDLEGHKNGQLNNLSISFYDRANKYDKNRRPVGQQILTIGSEYADDYEQQFKQYAQKYYIDFITEAFRNHLAWIAQWKQLNRRPSDGNHENVNDDFTRLLNFYLEKRNAGSR